MVGNIKLCAVFRDICYINTLLCSGVNINVVKSDSWACNHLAMFHCVDDLSADLCVVNKHYISVPYQRNQFFGVPFLVCRYINIRKLFQFG